MRVRFGGSERLGRARPRVESESDSQGARSEQRLFYRAWLIEGLALSRKFGSHAFPQFEAAFAKERLAGRFPDLKGMLWLDLLDGLEPAARERQTLEWLQDLVDLRLRYVAALGEILEAYPRELRTIQPDALARRELEPQAPDARMWELDPEAVVHGAHCAALEGLALHRLMEKPTGGLERLAIHALVSSREETWSQSPYYFRWCLDLGTRTSVNACLDTLGRIELLRKGLEEEAREIRRSARRTRPDDWKGSTRAWEQFNQAVTTERLEIVRQRLEQLKSFDTEAQAALRTFAARFATPFPDAVEDRPHMHWTQWFRLVGPLLPETADAAVPVEASAPR
ncbi:MAG: hypothetical protein R3E96_11010 [Planctomycetota bacterium]